MNVVNLAGNPTADPVESTYIYKDKDGNEKIVKLNPGKTWIGWISANNGGSLNI